ncbi:hypothetical protein T492DRAFT_1100843 [Pavlovales sp. CCMP2436]|nr:hypothetical protein T492DRAFT_1100843 [Pavlovales sp. CCMP2436]
MMACVANFVLAAAVAFVPSTLVRAGVACAARAQPAMTAASRRVLVQTAALALSGSVLLPPQTGMHLLSSAPALAVDDGALLAIPPSVAMRTVADGRAAFTVPGLWAAPGATPRPWLDGPLARPVADEITVTARETTLTSLDDLGDVSYAPLAKLGFTDLARADLVAAVRRVTISDDGPYFDFDLAISPSDCAKDQQILPGSCLPTQVVLLSLHVRDGTLYALRVNASPAQWRQAGTTLRQVRKSFIVA